MSAGNNRYAQLEQGPDCCRDDLWRSRVARCMHGAMGTESMARELGVHLDARELQADANAIIGIGKDW